MADKFFQRFREAITRLPDGLVRLSRPATDAELAEASAKVGVLPADYESFLRSFDGADLFHEAIVLAGVGLDAPRALVELNEGADAFVFGEAVVGDRFAIGGDGRVLRLRAGSDERAIAGSSFEKWLEATVARERVLYGADGEFADDVFDEDGEELRPLIVLRQTERALKIDAGAAEALHERGVALRRLGRVEDAIAAFAEAAELDAENPWPWFDLGRAALADDPARALTAFREAAARARGPEGAQVLAWAARAALSAHDEVSAAAARADALSRDPELLDSLLRAEAQAALEEDDDARSENEALRFALAPDSRPRRALPVLTSAAVALPRTQRRGSAAPAPITDRGGPAGGAEPLPRQPPSPPRRPSQPKPPRSDASPRAARPKGSRPKRR